MTGRRAVLLGVAALIVLCAPARAQDAAFARECESRLEPARLEVVVPASAVRYDFSRSVAELSAARRAPTPGQYTLGLTVFELKTSLEWRSNMLRRADGTACLRPHIRLTLDVGPQLVYIGREFPRGSCAFNDIARHELLHVHANQTRAEAVGAALKTALERQFGNRVFHGQAEQLRSQLESALRQSWFAWAQQQLREVDKDHAAIDSPQEYARNLTVCNGEIARTLQARQSGG